MGHKLGLTAGLLLMAMALPAAAQKVAGLDGDWIGAIVAPTGAQLRLAMHVESTATATTATLISLDQGNSKIPVASVTHKGNEVTLDVPSVPGHGGFKGTLSGKTLAGNWTQGAGSLPLTFTRQAAAKPAK